MAEQDAAVHEDASQQLPVTPVGGTPPLVAPQEGPLAEENHGGAEGREGAVSPQFSTTSTLSGDVAAGNPFLGSDISLDRTPAPSELSRVPQTLPNGAEQSSSLLGATGDPRGDIMMEITEIPEGSEAIIATTAGTWEKFEPATFKEAWEVFDDPSEEGGRGGEGAHLGAGKEGEEEGGAEAVAVASYPKKPLETTEATSAAAPSQEVKKKMAGSPGDRGAVCAADALLSSEWTALHDSGERGEEEGEGLPFRKTQSMRATAHRRVQIVDALKQQRRLSNSSLGEGGRGVGAQFSNEDELSKRFNREREWQLFVKMNKRVPGTR